MAKRGSGGGLWVVLGIIVVVALVPKEIWIALGIAGVLGLGLYLFIHFRKAAAAKASADALQQQSAYLQGSNSPESQQTLAELMAGQRSKGKLPPRLPKGQAAVAPPPLPSRPTSASPTEATRLRPPAQTLSQARDDFYSTQVAGRAPSTESFAVPKPPPGFGDARWLAPGESIQFADLTLPGGMIYLGARLNGLNGRIDPALITAQANVARHGDFRERQMSYWPSYADISPAARRAYLNWLAEGRSHPECDLGYVFLFFYGLERRVIVDSPRDPAARADWPAISTELRRLLSIYGQDSGSFRRYAGELLDWMEVQSTGERLYTLPVPVLPRSYELPRYLRLALGQSAVDRAPVPAQLALAWVRLNPDISLRTAAVRCPEEFDRLFLERYGELLGAGLVLPKNRTKLKFVYQPASSGFHGASPPTMTFGDIPDPTALTAPVKTLQEIANQCSDELGAFSRLVGKDNAARSTLDGLLQLPASLWPQEARAKLSAVVDRMRGGVLTLPLTELVAGLGGSSLPFNRDRIRGLARALEASAVGIEPNVLAGAKAPVGTDPVVLFSMPPAEAKFSDSGAYQTAVLTLQLASAVAQADGEFNATEVAHLRSEIQNWSHLTPAHQLRLNAHLQWLIAAPVSLASLKKKLEPLELKAKETVAAFMATLAQADGMVSPDEMRFLEKVYKALGVEPKRVFSDVHAVSSGSPTKAPQSTDRTGFKLDPKRIAELQQDTAKVSALLAGIFKEEEAPAPKPIEEPETQAEPGLLGLDTAHTALLRLLLSRPQWSRAELEDAAADLDLMLDGALEQVNEASFDAFDLPFTDGEDPVEVNAEVVEKIER